MNWVAIAAALLAAAGVLQAMLGVWLLSRMRAHAALAGPLPAISVLKPLHGDEPMLEAALASICGQNYAPFQVVFGVHDSADPALAVVERLRARFPECDIAVVVDPTIHGSNRKISNLINMLPEARHDILLLGDSDMRVAPDYLRRVVAALAVPGTGLVTTLYAGLAATSTLAGRLGATAISHGFLPGALMARALGRRDCLGATMALRRETLTAIGGLAALANHLADDNRLGRLVEAHGLSVGIADAVPATTVPETTLLALFRHELRWARTIRSLVPAQFALSSMQYPLAWALVAMAAADFAAWSVGVFLATWLFRAATALDISRRLPQTATPPPVWLLPLRDLMSVAVVLAAYGGQKVHWRGHGLYAEPTAKASRPLSDAI